MIEEIKHVQHMLETASLKRLGGIDEEVYTLYKENPVLAIQYLNETFIKNAEDALDR